MAEIRKLDPELIAEIKTLQEKAMGFLGLTPNMNPKEVVETINTYIRELKSAQGCLDDQDTIIGIGVLLGEQYVREFGWHWGEVIWDGDEANSRTCVLSVDNSLSINPIWWVNDVLTTERGTNFLLNFNMVAANKVPVADPDAALGFH